MKRTTSKFATLLGTASSLTIAGALTVHAQPAPMMAQAASEEIPENVLVTGSLIHGTSAVGVPVTNLTPMDFAITGATKIGDLFKDYPQANVSETSSATYSGGHLERETRVNLRGLDATGPRALMMIDGMRYPPQADGICAIDPSIIPAISLDHIDVLADGASATYGSDAISGVINVILRRNFDGAMTQLGFSTTTAGKLHYLASQLWGRTWDGGQVTLSYEWYDDSSVPGKAHSDYTMDYRPWGLDDRRPIASSDPGTVSANAPVNAVGTSSGTNCTNCMAIPRGRGQNFAPGPLGFGPTAPGSAPTFDWLALSADANFTGPVNGMRNVIDPLKLGWEDAAQQRNAAVITVDQRLTRDINFFAEAVYSNRRNQLLDAPNQTPTNNVAIASIRVPTWNPYYPTNAPNNVQVAYNIGLERPPWTSASEVSVHYAFGLNIALPADWHAEIHHSDSADASSLRAPGALNKNAVSAALGWTIAAVPATPSGTTPGFQAWAKPATVPYLDLFCDPTTFHCNSRSTLQYIGGFRAFDERMADSENVLKFDGPLFDLPAGQVKAAIGGSMTAVTFSFVTRDNSGASNLILQPIVDSEPYNIWATFAQLNIPIMSDTFNVPLIRKLDLEASWRHDQYQGTLQGATSNPKIGFTWVVSEDAGLSIKGAWGTSFRFANAGEYSPTASTAIGSFNLPSSLATNAQSVTLSCDSAGHATAGSLAAQMKASGFACGSTPGGISIAGAPFQYLRPAGIRENFALGPESATNWSIGTEFAPQAFLPGLDLQATYYVIRIANVLVAFNNQNSNNYNSAADGFHWIVPSDLTALNPSCNVAADLNPAACPEFEAMVDNIINNTRNAAVLPPAKSQIFFINDGGTVNHGIRKVDGLDWSASYDWDMGNIGAFNTGMTGTYYLHDVTNNPGAPPDDRYSKLSGPVGTQQQLNVPILPRFRYRARLGWSNGPWTLTGFLNYQSHYFHTQTSPPNVNNQCLASDPHTGGGTSPCTLNNYTNVQPPWYSFDLSLGYTTGDTPANDYLKNIGINLVVQNLLNIHPAFQYGPSNSGRSFAAYDILKSNEGRVISILVSKTW